MTPSKTAGSASPSELEIKLFVPPSSVAGVWEAPLVTGHVIGPRKTQRLTNRYFDTPDRELAQQRMALRLRGDGSGWVQTLKAGGAGTGALSRRGEWEEAVHGPALDWAKLAATPLAGFVAEPAARKRLQAVFETDFERTSQMLRLPDGSEVEFAFDRGTIVANDVEPVTICEVEIELKRAGGDDPESALLRFAAHLARSVPMIPLAASKAARGYAAIDGRVGQATKPTLPRPHADDPPARQLAGVLAACNEALLANVHALFERHERHDDLVEPVHQARVAIRRMRSAIRLFRPAVDGKRLRAIDADLQAINRVFGTVRDADVLMTTTMPRLDAHVGQDDAGREALHAIRGELEDQRTTARRALMEALDTGTFGATALAIERVVRRLEQADGGGPTLGDRAPRWLERQYGRVVERARRLASLDDEARHGLRIEVKRLRYALDLLDGLYDDAVVAGFHAALSDLQDRLGQLNDEAVARELLAGARPGAALDMVLARDETWFAQRLTKQLPKVAADAMKLELAPRPWTAKRAAAVR